MNGAQDAGCLFLVGRGDPFQGPKAGSCLTLRNELSEDTHAETARDFTGKGCLGGEQEGQGTQEDCSATCLTVSDFGDGMGCLWQITLTQGPS